VSVIKRSDLITDEAFNWPREYQKDLEGIITTSKKLGQGGAKKNIDELSKVQRQLSVATERSSKEFIEQKAALNTLNTTTRNAVKDVQNLDNAYDRLSKELNDTRKSFKNLAAAGKENTKEAKEQLRAITRLDAKLKKIDRTTGQNFRTIGAYTQGIKAAVGQMLLWAAGITAVIRVLGNAFRRVRAFDKSIVELTAILGKDRKELKAVEEQIIKVASASTKTSSEVADLAVALATLGKTEFEIERLLKPVNNLAIALKATSEEAGQLLVGTLNAFGESADEAIKYGDVIAKLRTSSALNFQGISDALGFLAPTANAVGLSIERTSAIIGILRDNNIKAARAGRLMSSSFATLITKGLTLDEALDKINGSTNKVATATDLFGKESFALALILADNVDEVNELDKALQNAGGSLQELTDKQLSSLDAKLKILDSAFERFILTITAGDNAIGRDFAGSVETLTGWFERLADAISGTDRRFENWKDSVIEMGLSTAEVSGQVALLTQKLKEEEEILARTDLDFTGRTENIRGWKKQLVFLIELQERIIKSEMDAANAIDDNTDALDDNTEAVEDNVKALRELDSLVAKLPPKLTVLQQGLLDITESLFGKSEIDQATDNFVSKIGAAIKKVAGISRDAKAEELAADQLLAEQKQAILNNSFQLAGEIAGRFTDLKIQQIGQELTAIEFARDRELELAGDNVRQKLEINRKFDEERKQLQRKQAVAERQNAIFQIALNTAIGIANAASKVVTIPLIPFIAAIGAVQLAAVLAAPIPTFDEGTERTPKDYIAGEKRPELRKSKGKWSLVDKPTLFKDSPGDKIVSGKETDSILGNITDLTNHNILTDKGSILSLLNNDIKIEKRKDANIAYILERNNADLIRTIKNKKETSISVKNAKVTEISSGRVVHIFNHYYVR